MNSWSSVNITIVWGLTLMTFILLQCPDKPQAAIKLSIVSAFWFGCCTDHWPSLSVTLRFDWSANHWPSLSVNLWFDWSTDHWPGLSQLPFGLVAVQTTDPVYHSYPLVWLLYRPLTQFITVTFWFGCSTDHTDPVYHSYPLVWLLYRPHPDITAPADLA